MKRLVLVAAAMLGGCSTTTPLNELGASDLAAAAASGSDAAADELVVRGEGALPAIEAELGRHSSNLLQETFHRISWRFGPSIRGGVKEIKAGMTIRTSPGYASARTGEFVVVHEQEENSHFVRCRRANDATVVWQVAVADVFGIGMEGGCVLVLGGSDLQVRDLKSGKRLWSVTVGYNLWLNCVHTGAGVFMPDDDLDKWVCRDWTTGTVLWRVPGRVLSALTLPGGDVVVAQYAAAERYDSTGRVVWRRPWLNKIHHVPLLLLAGTLVASSRGQNQEHEVLCLDPATGNVRWQSTGRELGIATASPDGMAIYISSAGDDGDGQVEAIDTTTWTTKWKRAARALGLAADIDRVFVGDWRGGDETVVRCLSAKTGDELWTAQIAGLPLPKFGVFVSGPLQSPVPHVVVRGTHVLVVLRGSGGTNGFCFDAESGRQHFEFPK